MQMCKYIILVPSEHLVMYNKLLCRCTISQLHIVSIERNYAKKKKVLNDKTRERMNDIVYYILE